MLGFVVMVGKLLLRYIVAVIVLTSISFGLIYGLLIGIQKLKKVLLPVKKDSGTSTKHVMVTGGSSGIGLEVARIYLRRGYKVTIIARNEKKLVAAMEDLKNDVANQKSTADHLQYISCDVGSTEENVKNSLAPAIKKFGDVEILVNSAGTSIAAPFDELDSKEFERMYRVNVLGSVFPTRVVLPAMKERKNGKIIFVTSQVAQVIFPSKQF
jgi:3-dehydrosphinganine reductase